MRPVRTAGLEPLTGLAQRDRFESLAGLIGHAVDVLAIEPRAAERVRLVGEVGL